MRTIRFLTGLLALALLGLTPLALSPSASADSARAVTAASTVSAPSAARAKLTRTLGDDFKQKANGAYVIYGKASPEGGNKKITFKKKDCKDCSWKSYKKVRTTSAGRWEVKVAFPCRTCGKATWYFRGRMKGGPKYKTARTLVYLSCRRKVC